MNAHVRTGRGCSRVGCRAMASMTLTYIYADSTAVVGPLATFSEPHAYDLCEVHGKKLTVPHGWNVIKEEANSDRNIGPSEDDLMAIADAVREAAAAPVEPAQSMNSNQSSQANIGRRGHLRAVPSQ
ncbi:MAG: DUF3499 family protein [Actinobacteria bacterium]|nr:DUF3499 family protein [Actinomycetota bacterium]